MRQSCPGFLETLTRCGDLGWDFVPAWWGLGVGTWSGDLDSQMNDLKLTICHCNEAAYLDGGCEASSDH